MGQQAGKVRSVPMADEVVAALDSLSQRDRFTDPDEAALLGQAFPQRHRQPGYGGGMINERSTSLGWSMPWPPWKAPASS